MQKSFIGIDFGTTNTSVSRILFDDLGGVRFLNYGEDRNSYPFASMLAIHKKTGEMRFGREVKRHRMELENEYFIISSFKSLLGTDKEFVIANKKYTGSEIVASYLLLIKQYIKENHDFEITEATFALPIGLSAKAREGLKLAAEQGAKIKVAGFIGESTAAYVANRKQAKGFSKVMVVDFGGGTIDISILDIKSGRLYETAVFGDKCGGDDIDRELAEKLHARLITETGKQISFDTMKTHEQDAMLAYCETIKIELATEEETTKPLIKYGDFGRQLINISYEFFKGVITPIINLALTTIKTAMERAGVSKESIEAVILVGGSSALRAYYEKIQSIFGAEKIITPNNMQWSVAEGAALIALANTDFILSEDVCVLLSDNSTYKLLEKNRDKVGTKTDPVTFAITEAATSANFIFTNESKTVNYGYEAIPTKGFLQESITLVAEITKDQIANITISNRHMGTGKEKIVQINKLSFHYDLQPLENF